MPFALLVVTLPREAPELLRQGSHGLSAIDLPLIVAYVQTFGGFVVAALSLYFLIVVARDSRGSSSGADGGLGFLLIPLLLAAAALFLVGVFAVVRGLRVLRGFAWPFRGLRRHQPRQRRRRTARD